MSTLPLNPRLALTIALLAGISPGAIGADQILIFAGQSNMQGKGTSNTAGSMSASDKAVIPNVYGFYSNGYDTGTGPDPWGGNLYPAPSYNFWRNWATWQLPSPGPNGVYAAGGSWQPYAYWRQSWTGSGGYAYNKGTDGSFWHIGLNPGEPWSNSRQFTSGEPVQEYGPEYTVAKTLHAARPGDTFCIVKYAPGGTSLGGDWQLNDPWGCYVAMREWVQAAQAQRPGAQIAGFFWLQGESDALSAPYSAAYQANLSALINKVRTDFSVPTLPVVIAKIHPGHPTWNYGTIWAGTNGPSQIAAVRNAQTALANPANKIATVETSDLNLLLAEWNQKRGGGADRNDAVLADVRNVNGLAPVHFDAAGIRTIGSRMGDAWLAMTTATPAVPQIQLGSASVSVAEGGSANISVRLSSQPTSDVTVTVAITGDGSLAIGSGSSLVFTTTNWNTPQLTQITAAQDADTANGTATVTASATGLTNVSATATEIDDDAVSLVTSATTANVTEGGTVTFTVSLSIQPTTTTAVTISRTAGDSDIAVTGGSMLSFTTTNWATPQTVTIAAAEDADSASGVATITISSPGLVSRTITVSENDNDPVVGGGGGGVGTRNKGSSGGCGMGGGLALLIGAALFSLGLRRRR